MKKKKKAQKSTKRKESDALSFQFRLSKVSADKFVHESAIKYSDEDEFLCELRIKARMNEDYNKVTVQIFFKVDLGTSNISDLVFSNVFELKQPIDIEKVDETDLTSFYNYIAYQSINQSRGAQAYIMGEKKIPEFIGIPFLSIQEVSEINIEDQDFIKPK